jgi:superfamily II DNA helicase RecQ
VCRPKSIAHDNCERVLGKCRDVFISAVGMASSCLNSEECASSVANAVFKVPALRQEQVDVITAILCGHDVIAVLPSGFGKSLCCQVGTMMLGGFTLLVTPLLALCEEQIAFMKAHNVPVVRVNSTLDHTSQKSICERIMTQSYKSIILCHDLIVITQYFPKAALSNGPDPRFRTGPRTFKKQLPVRKVRRSLRTLIMSDDCDVEAVYTTPETLKHNVRVVTALRVAREGGRVNFATIDNAHCVLGWSDFR